MAKTEVDTALHHIRGKLDGFVYRRFEGGTIIQRRPRFKGWSARQTAQREAFRSGSIYAAAIKQIPAIRALYEHAAELRGGNYRHAAIGDALNPPTITGVELYDYTPRYGGTFRINAHDDFEVAFIMVALRNAAGTLLDFRGADLVVPIWECTVKPPPDPSREATSAVITAYDRPGNFAIGEFSLVPPRLTFGPDGKPIRDASPKSNP